jgi:hypothetical protein
MDPLHRLQGQIVSESPEEAKHINTKFSGDLTHPASLSPRASMAAVSAAVCAANRRLRDAISWGYLVRKDWRGHFMIVVILCGYHYHEND